MSDISNLLIKDSFNYVLQSDLITGVIFRIGGTIPQNPKFQSGLTVNTNFTYSNGTEFPGYVLTCDAFGNGIWAPVSGTSSSVIVTGGTFDYSNGTLELRNSNGSSVTIPGLEDIYITGGTVSGSSIFFTYNDTSTFEISGITSINTFNSYTANTENTLNSKVNISTYSAYTATTEPLILNSVTGGTYSGGTLFLINNSGNTVEITGFTSSSGGTSNLQYYITGSTPTGIINSGDRWFNTQTGIELVYIDDGDSQQWVQPYSVPGPAGQDLGVYSTTGITSSQTITWDKTYWGISGSTNVDLSLPTTVGKDGYFLIIKDESGLSGTYRIRLTPSIGLIDGNNYVDMNINYMSLTCMSRGGNWYLI